MFSNTEKHNTIGLDISDLSIKLVQLKKNKGKNKVQAISKYRLKPGIIDNGIIINKEELVKSIIELTKKTIYGSVTTKNVVVSIPETKAFIKSFSIDKSPNQLKDMVIPVIENNIPYSLDDIYYDWQITEHNASFYEVLIAAAPRKVIDEYISTLEEAGLSVLALETESMAVCRCVLTEESPDFKGDSTKAYAILDIGAKSTTLTIYSNHTIVLSVGIDVSGEEATDTIAETLQIKKTQAEKAKIICGLDKTKAEGIISDILSSIIERMTNKIKEVMDYYHDQYTELNKIGKLFIAGGGSNIKHLDKIISEKISLESAEAKIFTNIDEDMDKFLGHFTETHNMSLDILKSKASKAKSKSKDKDNDKNTATTKQNASLGYATAIGLALRNQFD